jgi:hypothetical protein
MRNLRNQVNMKATMVNKDGTATSDVATPGGADPYTIQMHMISGGASGSYFHVGGQAS